MSLIARAGSGSFRERSLTEFTLSIRRVRDDSSVF
jgi:hypothetical protein